MSTPAISGEFPANGSSNLGLRPQIAFSLTVDTAYGNIQCYVNSVLAYDKNAGGLQSGFVDTVDWLNPGGIELFGTSFSATFQQVAFLPQATANIPIRVVASDNMGNTLDTTWHISTASTPQNPYPINLADDAYVSVFNGVMSIYDPFRWTAICDPISGEVIDNTQMSLTLGGAPVITGGVAQSGYVLTQTAVLGGYLFELYQTGHAPWLTGITQIAELYLGSTTRSDLIQFTFTPTDPEIPHPPDGSNVVSNWDSLQPSSGYSDLQSGLGPPVYDTITVSKNSGPPVTIYDSGAGGFEAPWAGSFLAENQGPEPPAVNQNRRVSLTPPAGFTVTGDTVAFSAAAHIVSPFTSVRYPISGSWNWTIFNAAPAVPGKKYALELAAPNVLIVRTSLDGVATDCDFNLALARVRVHGDD